MYWNLPFCPLTITNPQSEIILQIDLRRKYYGSFENRYNEKEAIKKDVLAVSHYILAREGGQ